MTEGGHYEIQDGHRGYQSIMENHPFLSVAVTGKSSNKILICCLQISAGELAGLISFGNKHVDRGVRVDLTIFSHGEDAEDILNLLVSEFLAKSLEHAFECVGVNGTWGSTFE